LLRDRLVTTEGDVTASSFLERLHRFVGRNPRLVEIARRLRNQCNLAIGQHLGASCDVNRNGELWLLQELSPHLKIVFDVGANLGHWTDLVRSHQPAATVHMFECSADLAKRLQMKYASSKEIHVHAIALGDFDERRVFFEDRVQSEHSSFVVRNQNNSDVTSYDVQVSTVDSFCIANAIHGIDLLKIDTEGCDFQVLRGASQMISTAAIKVVQFEYGDTWRLSGETLAACLRWLGGHGYQTSLLRQDGNAAFDYERWGEFFGYSNFVAYAPTCDFRR
jgi:FkbM family methyltransferase